MPKFSPGDQVFGKFQGMEAEGTVLGAEDMTGFDPDAPQIYTIEVEDGFGEPAEVISSEERMTLVRAAGEAYEGQR